MMRNVCCTPDRLTVLTCCHRDDAISCAHLRKIVLSGCRNVTDAGVIPLIATCKHLRVLDLDRCNKITDRAVIAVTLL